MGERQRIGGCSPTGRDAGARHGQHSNAPGATARGSDSGIDLRSPGVNMSMSSKHEKKFSHSAAERRARSRALTCTSRRGRPSSRSGKDKSACRNSKMARRSRWEIQTRHGLDAEAGITRARWRVPAFLIRSLPQGIARGPLTPFASLRQPHQHCLELPEHFLGISWQNLMPLLRTATYS